LSYGIQDDKLDIDLAYQQLEVNRTIIGKEKLEFHPYVILGYQVIFTASTSLWAASKMSATGRLHRERYREAGKGLSREFHFTFSVNGSRKSLDWNLS